MIVIVIACSTIIGGTYAYVNKRVEITVAECIKKDPVIIQLNDINVKLNDIQETIEDIKLTLAIVHQDDPKYKKAEIITKSIK
ncbi:MAG: hypothetical protein PHF86_07565 [Candidatus Nanoarchaeia archaeon]|nr:hypothetical protein [Candidatus Nanoarchaeia archaeon]